MGASTCVSILPAEQIGVVALSNASPVGAPEAVCRTFIDLIMGGKIERDWLTLFGGVFAKMNEATYSRDVQYDVPPPAAPAPTELSAYAGIYQNELYGPLSIEQGATVLRLSFGEGRSPYPMRHFSGNIFTFQPRGENAFGPSAMRFSLDESGRAQSILIDYFDATGQGHFIRA